MNKSELIKRMCDKLDQLTSRDVDLAVQTIIDTMSESLAGGERIEIRGFGTFSNHYRKPRSVRNPKTGEVGINKQQTWQVRAPLQTRQGTQTPGG